MGLRNAHTLATKVYEKGPQSLADTIKEVEKLQAAQQITSTLLPPSLANTMSSDNDKCFQCQETGHMACYCPHIRCFDCNNYGHVAADALTKYHLQAHQHNAETTPLADETDQHLVIIATPGIPTVTMEMGTDSVDLDLTHITPGIGVTVIVILTEAILDHFTSPHTKALHATGAPTYTTTNMTCHIADPHHADISAEMPVDPEPMNPTGTTTNPHKDHLPVHNQHPGSLRIEGPNRLQLMIHPWNIIAQMNRTVIQRMT